MFQSKRMVILVKEQNEEVHEIWYKQVIKKRERGPIFSRDNSNLQVDDMRVWPIYVYA